MSLAVSDNDSESTIDLTGNTNHNQRGASEKKKEKPTMLSIIGKPRPQRKPLGTRLNKRVLGARGVPRSVYPKSGDNALVECIQEVVKQFTVLTNSISALVEHSLEVTRILVQSEVKKAMEGTNSSIDEIKAMIVNLSSKSL